ncbi:MAG: hypothetical protein WDZ49_13810 [Litorilinea sp.]
MFNHAHNIYQKSCYQINTGCIQNGYTSSNMPPDVPPDMPQVRRNQQNGNLAQPIELRAGMPRSLYNMEKRVRLQLSARNNVVIDNKAMPNQVPSYLHRNLPVKDQ